MDSLCKKELEIYATKIRMGIIEGTYNDAEDIRKKYNLK